MNIKKSILKHMIYNHHKKYGAIEIMDWLAREVDSPVGLEQIIQHLHELKDAGFLKEFREENKTIPVRYQAEPGYIRKLIEKVEL